MTTANILSCYIPAFYAFVEKKNQKAIKLGCQEIRFDISEPFLIEKSMDGIVSNTRTYEYVTVSVVEETIKLNGYSVIGRIDDIEGEIIVSGMSDMSKYRSVSMDRCDHCNIPRNRKHLVLLSDGQNETVVGSTCLIDYTGHTSALSYLSSLGWVMDLQETLDSEGMSNGDSKSSVFSIDRLLTVGAAVVRKYGYVSKAKSEESGVESTKSSTIGVLFSKDLSFGQEIVTEKDVDLVSSLMDWYSSTDHPDTDFFHNVSVFMEKGYVPIKFSGYIVGLIPWYLKSKEHKSSVPSEYISTIGQKAVRMDLKLVRAINMGSFAYNSPPSFLYIFRSGSNIVVYKTTMVFEEDVVYSVSATIKDHSDYNGTKQTVITRAKILEKASSI